MPEGGMYGGVSVPVLAAFWWGNRRGKNRAGTIGGAQYTFAHVHKGNFLLQRNSPPMEGAVLNYNGQCRSISVFYYTLEWLTN